jgi:phosphoserine phosphatase
MPDVVLIRPGCTDFDEQNRIQGSLDLPLNRRGQEQVEFVVEQLRDVHLDVIFAPPCEPAHSTAIAVGESCRAAVKEVEDFCNLNHGLWQGLQIDDVRRKFPKVYKQWHEAPESVRLPEGETVAEAVERIQHGLKKCLKRKKSIAIVASEPLATLIRCVLCGCRPEFPETPANGKCSPTIEFLHLSDENVRDIGKANPTPPFAQVKKITPNGKASNGSPSPSAPANSAASNGSSSSGAAAQVKPQSSPTNGHANRTNGAGHSVDPKSTTVRRGVSE